MLMCYKCVISYVHAIRSVHQVDASILTHYFLHFVALFRIYFPISGNLLIPRPDSINTSVSQTPSCKSDFRMPRRKWFTKCDSWKDTAQLDKDRLEEKVVQQCEEQRKRSDVLEHMNGGPLRPFCVKYIHVGMKKVRQRTDISRPWRDGWPCS